MVKRDQTEEKLSFILGIPKNSYLIVFMHKGFADVFDMGGLREESAACPLPASLALEMFARNHCCGGTWSIPWLVHTASCIWQDLYQLLQKMLPISGPDNGTPTAEITS